MTDERVHELILRGMAPRRLEESASDKMDLYNLRYRTGATRAEADELIQRWGIRVARVRVSAMDVTA